MQKTLLTGLALLCLGPSATAQISKGSLYFGGNIGYSNTTEERSAAAPQTPAEGESKVLTVSPTVGIALRENLVVGINLLYGNTNQENYNNTAKYESTVLGAGVFLRRYFLLARRFYAFGEAGLGYSNGSTKQGNASGLQYRTEMDAWSVGLGLYPGLSYNVHKALFLEMGFANLLQLSYERQQQTETPVVGAAGVTTRKNLTLSSSLTNGSTLNVGVRFIIPRRTAAK